MDDWLKKLIIYLLLFVSGIFFIKYLFIYFSPFIIAAIISSLINPVVEKVEEWFPLGRGLAVLFVLILLIAVLVFFIILGGSQIYLELNRLLRHLPDYSTFGNQFTWILHQNNNLQKFINELDISPAVREALNNNLQLLYNTLRNGLVQLINNALNLLSKLPLILTILFLSFIATFFMSKDRDKINDFIMGLFPIRWKAKVFKVEKELVSSAIKFIRAEIILITITGIISGVGLAIIGNQYALVIGISSALLDLIPIIGPALIFVPWIIYVLALGDFAFGFSLLLVYTLMAAVRQGAEGKVMGSNLGFHPLAIMIVLYVGFRTMGPIGFVIGPTILVFIKAIIKADIISINK